jgi:hypothetical protein
MLMKAYMSNLNLVKESLEPWIKKCSKYYEGTDWDDEYDSQCWALLVHILDFADDNNCLLEAVDWLADLSVGDFLDREDLRPCGNMIYIKACQLIDVENEIEGELEESDLSEDEYREHLRIGYRKFINRMTDFVPHQLQL